MTEAQRLLELIERGLVEHGGDLGGWTSLAEAELRAFDGRMTLAAQVKEVGPRADQVMVHAHVLATLHEYDDEVLDACLAGIGPDVEAALSQAAVIWLTGVAGPIRSFLDNKPVCMTCQAGVQAGDLAEGFSEADYGLPGLRAYVGPAISRGIGEAAREALDGGKPWFRFAAEAAAPRRVHLAKASVLSKGPEGWSRDLEIDGHEVSHHDPDWAVGVECAEVGYLTRFAVFEFPSNSAAIARRAELERTIGHFATHFKDHETADALMAAMVEQGFDADLVHEAESIATIAFGRAFFEPLGVRYAPTIIRARRDGRVEVDVPLMSLPAFTRAKALIARLAPTMPQDEYRAICFYTAESNAILQALNAHGDKLDLTKINMQPCVVPDRGVDDATMDAALKVLHDRIERNRPPKPARKKPWWRFW